MNAIQELMSKYDWNLMCWDDRYSRGLWAIVAPHQNHSYEIREIMDGGDIESSILGDYFSDDGSWLPVSNGKNLMEILNNLNEKIKPFIDNNVWKKSVNDAFQKILEENDGNYGLRIAIEKKEKELIKPEEL